jgi:hypothetical protein
MKKNIFLKSLLFLSSSLLAADDQHMGSSKKNQILEKAQSCFLQAKWSLAFKNYQLLEDKNGPVLQNMGICLFNIKKYPQALVKFKQAFAKSNLNQFRTLVNLEKRVYEKLDKPSPSWTFYGVKKLFSTVPLVLVQSIFLILLLLLLYFFIRHWRWSDFTKQEKLFLKRILSVLCLCGIFWYAKLLYFDKYQAIVIKSQVLVYAGPEKTFHVIEKLHIADEVEILAEKDGMYHIQYLKTSGWIDCDTVELINNYE